MIKLGLIGKNITHSKSPEMYKKILLEEFEYELLDCTDISSIPNLDFLKNNFNGISITAPYKNHFIDKVIVDPELKYVNAINCLSFNNNEIVGFNTDLLAIVNIIKKYNYLNREITILGDGAMFRVLKLIFDKEKKDFKHFHRKKDGDLSRLSLIQKNNLVINTCAREFSFEGLVDSTSIFWDLNYLHKNNQHYLSDKCNYIDGEELLFLQALEATKIWGLKHNSF